MFSVLLAEEDCSIKRGQPSITRDLPKSSSSFSSSSSFISPHEIMNGSLNGWLFDIRVRIMGILPTLYSSLFCLLCYLQSQSLLIFRKSYIRGF